MKKKQYEDLGRIARHFMVENSSEDYSALEPERWRMVAEKAVDVYLETPWTKDFRWLGYELWLAYAPWKKFYFRADPPVDRDAWIALAEKLLYTIADSAIKLPAQTEWQTMEKP